MQSIELQFACENLVNVETFSKDSPVLYLLQLQNMRWVKLGQTELIHNNLNPQWLTKILVSYNFERNDKYRLEVHDVVDQTKINNMNSNEALGYLEFTIHEVVTSPNQLMKRRLVYPVRPNH